MSVVQPTVQPSSVISGGRTRITVEQNPPETRSSRRWTTITDTPILTTDQKAGGSNPSERAT